MPLLTMTNISKRFGAVQALQDVSLTLDAGEVLGIVGENGAGKSTLIKILGGAYFPDAGTIVFDNEPITIDHPESSLSRGITVIYQELSLVPELSVAENLFLGHMPHNALGGIKRTELMNRSRALLERIQLDVSPRQRLADLRIDARQLIEVGKALSRDVRILVMDEPTSSLNEKEVQHLFSVVRHLKAEGVAIIYISHHLDEVFEICDRVMVLRDGKEVDTRPTADWTPTQIVEAMVDRPIEDFYPKATVPIGDVVFRADGLSLNDRVQNVSFDIHAGEIVGLGGLPGSGIAEVAQIVAGIRRPTGGSMTLQGQKYNPQSPHNAIQSQVGYVPEDRKEQGLFLEFSIRRNIALSILSSLSKFGVVNNKSTEKIAQKAIVDYKIKASGTGAPVKSLSGGNQQKVLLARVGQSDPILMIMNDPTRGIDVGAKVEVYERIGEFVQEGGAVLLLSSELPELIGISDRIVVLRNGQKIADIPRNEFSQNVIMSYAAGTSGGNNE